MNYYNKYIKYKYKYLNLKLTGGTMQTIILTVPHAKSNESIPNNMRTHDMVALSFAQKLEKKFTDNNYRVKTIISSQSRNIIDDNRNEAFNKPTLLWKELRKELNSSMLFNTILLDIHSFPNPYFDSNMIAFLENKTHTNSIGKILCNKLMIKDIKCNVYTAMANMNAIIDHNKQVKYILLIEVNESLSENELTKLSKEVYEGVIKILAEDTYYPN